MSTINATSPITGSSGSSDDNFSYATIASGVTKTIPLHQQMIVYQNINIVGDLDIIGDLVLID